VELVEEALCCVGGSEPLAVQIKELVFVVLSGELLEMCFDVL